MCVSEGEREREKDGRQQSALELLETARKETQLSVATAIRKIVKVSWRRETRKKRTESTLQSPPEATCTVARGWKESC